MKRSAFLAWLGGLVGARAWGQKTMPACNADRTTNTTNCFISAEPIRMPDPLEDPYYGAEVKITYPEKDWWLRPLGSIMTPPVVSVNPIVVKVVARMGDVVFFTIPAEGDDYISMLTVRKWREWIAKERPHGTKFEVVK